MVMSTVNKVTVNFAYEFPDIGAWHQLVLAFHLGW